MKQLLSILFLVNISFSQLLVGVDDSAVPVYWVNTSNGIATPLPVGTQVWGLAYDVDINLVYWNQGTILYRSPFTVPFVPETVGTMVLAGTMTSQSLVGLAYHGGKLYGTKNISNEGIYEVNPANAEVTLVLDYADADYDFGGLDFDPVTGKLYGTNDDATPHGSGVFEINLSTQAITKVADYPVGETDIDGFAAHNGIGYLIVDQAGNFFVYDLVNGSQVSTLPSPFTTSEVFSGGTFVPDDDRDFAPNNFDGCPIDGAKVHPGVCGCGQIEDLTDSNLNLIPDCKVGEELKYTAGNMRTKIRKVKKLPDTATPKQRRRVRNARSAVKKLLAEIEARIANDGTKVSVNNSSIFTLGFELSEKVKKGIKVNKARFRKNKKAAISNIDSFVGSIN